MIVTSIPTQFITNREGKPIAVILPIEVYEQFRPLLTSRVKFEWDDEGELDPEVGADLQRISAEQQAGKRGTSLDSVIQELGLD
ncbi:MAG: hypothetical protein KDE56_28735 [Anaerolineales bacterium]|nr:hypothetical protein [Anaerolineales bacterium]